MTVFSRLFSGALSPPTGRRSGGTYETGRSLVFEIVPVAKATNNLATNQTTLGAASLVLTAGAGVTSRVAPQGNTVYDLDVNRAVTLTSAANLSAINFTLTGLDDWGVQVIHTMAGPNANTVTFPKCVKTVVSIASSAAVGSNVSAGTDDVFQMPIAVLDRGYIPAIFWNGAADAGTFTAAVQTDPATVSTGDPRGKYATSSAADGVKRLIMEILISNAQFAAVDNNTGTYKAYRGVTQ